MLYVDNWTRMLPHTKTRSFTVMIIGGAIWIQSFTAPSLIQTFSLAALFKHLSTLLNPCSNTSMFMEPHSHTLPSVKTVHTLYKPCRMLTHNQLHPMWIQFMCPNCIHISFLACLMQKWNVQMLLNILITYIKTRPNVDCFQFRNSGMKWKMPLLR